MKPTIITITGPSCAGKSTLEMLLVRRGIAINAVSTTTRPMRSGEVNGESYYFKTREQFESGLALDEYIEHAEFGGNFYGMSATEIKRQAGLGKPIVVVCEPIGQKQIRAYCEENGWKLVSAFVMNPDEVICERFLERLANDAWGMSSEDIAKLTKSAAGRMKQMMTTERAWIAEAMLPKSYNLRFMTFNKDNQDHVIARIMNELT